MFGKNGFLAKKKKAADKSLTSFLENICKVVFDYFFQASHFLSFNSPRYPHIWSWFWQFRFPPMKKASNVHGVPTRNKQMETKLEIIKWKVKTRNNQMESENYVEIIKWEVKTRNNLMENKSKK